MPPPTGTAAGHTVKLQLLVMLNSAASPVATNRRRIDRRWRTREAAATTAIFVLLRFASCGKPEMNFEW
uniref:Uncharacterized protein n=1 Tax=Arundo donax TaxID=35708 RepID=A0A0A9EUA3_ARUDO